MSWHVVTSNGALLADAFSSLRGARGAAKRERWASLTHLFASALRRVSNAEVVSRTSSACHRG
jgi:hypothetical protein